MLLAACRQEVKRRALVTRINQVSRSARIGQDCFGRACQKGVDLRPREHQALLTLVRLLVARQRLDQLLVQGQHLLVPVVLAQPAPLVVLLVVATA